MSPEALLSAAALALADANYEATLGSLSALGVEELRASNRKLVFLELFIVTLGLASAKLPRYAAALEMHATLASQPGSTDGGDVPMIRLGHAALKQTLRMLEMVKTEATDMARKLDSFSK